MNNQIEQPSASTKPISGGFSAAFTMEEFQHHITVMYLFQMRVALIVTQDEELVWKMTECPEVERCRLFDPSDLTVDTGLKYEHIRKGLFASGFENLYRYAYLGQWDEDGENLQDGRYAWLAAIAGDTEHSYVGGEWDMHGWGEWSRSAAVCSLVAELANARYVLEGGEPYSGAFNNGKEGNAYNAMTIRQMALLSGMEEMSIRSAANPKRPNPLKTYTEDGRTLISREVAKEWLISKGRYVPITKSWSLGTPDLVNIQFADMYHLQVVVQGRMNTLVQSAGGNGILGKIAAIGLPLRDGNINLGEKQLRDTRQMVHLAEILEIDPDRFALRCLETVTRAELQFIERALRQPVSVVSNESNGSRRTS